MVRLEKILGKLSGSAVFVVEPAKQNSLTQIAEDSGFRIVAIDARDIKTKQDLFRAFAVSLGFPHYFGYNWDALEECIRDLSWLPPGNLLLIFENGDHLLCLGTKEFAVLISILSGATFSWKANGIVFSVVLLGGPALITAVERVLEGS